MSAIGALSFNALGNFHCAEADARLGRQPTQSGHSDFSITDIVAPGAGRVDDGHWQSVPVDRMRLRYRAIDNHPKSKQVPQCADFCWLNRGVTVCQWEVSINR